MVLLTLLGLDGMGLDVVMPMVKHNWFLFKVFTILCRQWHRKGI